jgi:hypothetical protein
MATVDCKKINVRKILDNCDETPQLERVVAAFDWQVTRYCQSLNRLKVPVLIPKWEIIVCQAMEDYITVTSNFIGVEVVGGADDGMKIKSLHEDVNPLLIPHLDLTNLQKLLFSSVKELSYGQRVLDGRPEIGISGNLDGAEMTLSIQWFYNIVKDGQHRA